MMLYKAMNLNTQKEVIRAARPSLQKQSSRHGDNHNPTRLHFSSGDAGGGGSQEFLLSSSNKGGGLCGRGEPPAVRPCTSCAKGKHHVSGQPRTPKGQAHLGKALATWGPKQEAAWVIP